MKKSSKPDTLYNFFHSKYKKMMGGIQKKEISQNPYTLKKMDGKHLYESSDDVKVDTLPFKRIEGTELSRVKEDKASYAIGDKDGNPITDFDFVFVSTEVRGSEDKKIEVITKEGESRFFDIDNKVLLECDCGGAAGGMSAGGMADGGMSAGDASGLPTQDSITTDVVGPKVGPDGTVTPMSAIGGCGKHKCHCDKRIPRGVGIYFGVPKILRKKKKRKHRKI